VVHQIPQSDLDARIRRAETHAVSELLKTLGVDTTDSLKAVIAADKARRDGELSDLQKAQGAVTTLSQERDDFKSKYEALLAQVKDDRTLAALRSAAPGVKHPEDILSWAREKVPDELAAILGEDHKADETKAKALVTKCQKVRPEWFSPETPGIPSNADAKGPGSIQQAQKLAEVALRQAKSFL
jgi:hypothetical protein